MEILNGNANRPIYRLTLVKIVESWLFDFGFPNPSKNEILGGDVRGGGDIAVKEAAAGSERGGEGRDVGCEAMGLVAAATEALVAVTRGDASLAGVEPSTTAATTSATTEVAATTQAFTSMAEQRLHNLSRRRWLVLAEVGGASKASERARGAVGLAIVRLRLLLQPELSTEDAFWTSYADLGRGGGFLTGEELGTPQTFTTAGDDSVVPEEQGVGTTLPEERDAGRAIPDEGVGMGTHEEVAEEAMDEEDEGAEPMQVPVIWTATERLTHPNTDHVDPSLDRVRGGIPIVMLVDWCKELCRAGERNERDVASMLRARLSTGAFRSWDAIERPMIQLPDESGVTYVWDTNEGYLDWFELLIHPPDHPAVHPDRVVPPPPPASMAVRQIVTGQMRHMLTTREGLPPDVTASLIQWIELLQGTTMPVADPILRTSKIFRDSVTKQGSGSGTQHDDP
ncbi:LOW QUALITY PROTEIN: hypothetical protein V2J09_011311 [Rumex salicifolius]